MNAEANGSHRPSRLYFAALLAMPGILLLVVRLLPVAQGIVRALTRVEPTPLPVQGWVSAAIIGIAQIALVVGIAVPAGRALASLRAGAGVARAVLAVPFFVPASVLTATLMSLFGLSPAGQGQATGAYWAIAVLVGVLQYAGIAAVVSAAPAGPARLGAAGVLGVAAVRISVLFAGEVDTVATMSASVAEPVIALPYGSFFALAPAPLAAAERAWLVHVSLQLVAIAAAFLLARSALRDVRARPAGGGSTGRVGVAHRIVLVLWLFLACAVMLYLVLRPIASLSVALEGLRELGRTVRIAGAIGRFILVGVVSSVLGLFVAVSAAYPLCSNGGRWSRGYAVALLAVAAIAPYAAHDYIYYRGLGMLNTFYPYLLRGLFPILMVFVLALWGSKPGDARTSPEPFRTLQDYLVPSRRLIAGLALVLFALSWNQVGEVGLYMVASTSAMSPVTLFRLYASRSAVGDPALLLLGLIVSLPPVAVYLALRRFAVDESLFGAVRS